MENAELKKSIQAFVEKADDRVLSIVNSVFEHFYQSEIVAHHPDGSPMTREAYKAALDISEEQLKNGELIPVEALENN